MAVKRVTWRVRRITCELSGFCGMLVLASSARWFASWRRELIATRRHYRAAVATSHSSADMRALNTMAPGLPGAVLYARGETVKRSVKSGAIVTTKTTNGCPSLAGTYRRNKFYTQ